MTCRSRLPSWLIDYICDMRSLSLTLKKHNWNRSGMDTPKTVQGGVPGWKSNSDGLAFFISDQGRPLQGWDLSSALTRARSDCPYLDKNLGSLTVYTAFPLALNFIASGE